MENIDSELITMVDVEYFDDKVHRTFGEHNLYKVV